MSLKMIAASLALGLALVLAPAAQASTAKPHTAPTAHVKTTKKAPAKHKSKHSVSKSKKHSAAKNTSKRHHQA